MGLVMSAWPFAAAWLVFMALFTLLWMSDGW